MQRYYIAAQFGHIGRSENDAGEWVLYEDVAALVAAAEKARYVLADECATRDEWNEALRALNAALGESAPLKMCVTNEWLKAKIEADGEVFVEVGTPPSPQPNVVSSDDWFSQVVSFLVNHDMLDISDEYHISDVMGALADNYEPALVKAVKGITDDFQTSENHHPDYVLIPTAKFEEIRAALVGSASRASE